METAPDEQLNFGEQPIMKIMTDRGLTRGDLVARSPENITFKMVSRACKGRKLTPHVKQKILHALNLAANQPFKLSDLFNY